MLLLALSLVLRLSWYHIQTSDYVYFVRPWFETLSVHTGLSAFSIPFSNYTPLYLYLLKLLAVLHVPVLAGVKTLSMVFDALLAWGMVLIVQAVSTEKLSKARLFLLFAAVFSIPTVALNSSMWAQSDAVYAAGVMASLYFVLKDRPSAAVAAFGLAFSVKLQAAFFLPVLFGYLMRKKYGFVYLLAIPVIYFLSILPAWAGGSPLKDLLLTYAHQANEYQYLVMSAPTVYTFIEGHPMTNSVRDAAVAGGMALGALIALGISILMVEPRLLNAKRVVLLSLISALAIPFVLPRMHERYFYLADIMSVVFVALYPRRWYMPVLVVSVSLLSYASYLSGATDILKPFVVDFRALALLEMLAIAILVPVLYREVARSLSAVDPGQPEIRPEQKEIKRVIRLSRPVA